MTTAITDGAQPQTSDTAAALLKVEDLTISFRSPSGLVHAVNGLDLTVTPRERVAIVGESGSGKSVTAQALLGLFHAPVDHRVPALLRQ